jgi:CheY-like chemotaxis protein
VVAKALAKNPGDRYETASAMADALARAMPPARPSAVGEWLKKLAQASLERRANLVNQLMSGPSAPPSSQSNLAAGGTAVMARPPPSERSMASATSSLRSREAPPPSSSRPDPTGPGSASSLRSRAPSSITDSGTGAKRPKHILVIDDSEVILANVRRALEADGYRVTTTTQTVGAARHLIDCDLAIIDFHMPGINGGDVIKSIRAAMQATSRQTSCLLYLYTADPNVAKTYATMGFDGAFTEKGDEAALQRQVRGALRVLQMRAMKR